MSDLQSNRIIDRCGLFGCKVGTVLRGSTSDNLGSGFHPQFNSLQQIRTDWIVVKLLEGKNYEIYRIAVVSPVLHGIGRRVSEQQHRVSTFFKLECYSAHTNLLLN